MKRQRKKIVYSFLTFLGAMLLIFYISNGIRGHIDLQRPTSLAQHMETHAPTTVALKTETGSGNGILWQIEEESVTILTVSHVAGDMVPGNTLEIDGNTTLAVEEVYVSKDFDLAFIRVKWQEGATTRSTVRVDMKSFDSIETEDRIYASGSLNNSSYIREGTVISNWIYMEDFGCHMLWGKMPDTVEGMSGSGIFDINGFFSGILCGKTQKEEIAVLPLSIIQTEWKNVDTQ